MSQKRADDDALGALHALVATELAKRIKGGAWTAADMTAAIAFLRANDIKAMPVKKSPLEELGEAVKKTGVELPFEGTAH